MSSGSDKQRVLILMGPFKSHFNCAFSFARTVQERYDVVFLGPLFLYEFVTRQGWKFHPIPLAFLHPSIMFKLFFGRLVDRIFNVSTKAFLNECQEIIRIIKSLSPELIFIDAHLTRYYPLFKELGIDIIIIQPMLSGNKENAIPPMNSEYVPSNNRWSNYYVEFLWKYFYLKKFIIRSYFHIASAGINHAALTRKLKAFDKRDFDYNTAGPPKIIGMREIFLYSSQIDFPWRKPKSNELYFGPAVDAFRKEVEVQSVNQYILAIKGTQSAKFVYCSFGTQPQNQNKHYRSFIFNLLTVADKNPLLFFLVTGSNDYQLKERINFKFVSYAPQLKILKHADLMITHGGLNSIQECILYCVPMLVYPLISYADHYGVSARVRYHNLGLTGDIKGASEESITFKINKLLSDPSYKMSMIRLNDRINVVDENAQFRLWLDSLKLNH